MVLEITYGNNTIRLTDVEPGQVAEGLEYIALLISRLGVDGAVARLQASGFRTTIKPLRDSQLSAK